MGIIIRDLDLELLDCFFGSLHTLTLFASLSWVSLHFSEKVVIISVIMREGTATCVDIFLAIVLPPLGVFFKYGCHAEFWICLLLTILGYIPGIIYAIYAITKENP